MTPLNPGEMRETIALTFSTLANKDLKGFLSLMTEEAVLIDPHFPMHDIKGQVAIREAITMSFKNMKSMGYKVDKFFIGEDGQSAAVEVSTFHVLNNGKELNFPQTFIFEFKGGLINRLQAYEPYGPGGIVGIFLSIARLSDKFKKK